MELINLGANVHWKHHDGATYLHVLISWLCDPNAAGMNKRLPPVGEQPKDLVSILIQHGVDPTSKQKWEGKGLSAVDTWRARKDESPWLEDERTFRDFEKVAKAIHKVFIKTADAMEQKVKANQQLKDKKYESACRGYENARKILSEAGVDGHHMASMWSNEAICRLQMGDKDGARNACLEGSKLLCSKELKAKLEHNLKRCDEAVIIEVREPSELSEPRTEAAPAVKTPAVRSQLQKGFLGNAKEMYGPEGSKQGQMPQFYKQPINGGEAVIDVPINQENCSQMKLIPMPDMPNPEDEVDDSGCIAKDM
jgi:hypothetical protein